MSDAPRVTMFDEYGRCIHCGFWHSDLSSGAARACAEHEAYYRDHGGCGCVFKKLPTPVKGDNGMWYSPSAPEAIAILAREAAARSAAPTLWQRLRAICVPRSTQ